MQRHITSVFSEYEAMDNNSANSKQLQYWLKQISNPISAPNLGFQWTFMTNQSSSFERPNNYTSNHISDQAIDQVSFGKTVHSSIDRDKENNSMVSNGNRGHNIQNKSKSYVNAMIALQKKVKTLQDQNTFMRRNMAKMHEQKSRSMSDSMATEEQLKAKLNLIEPRLAKIDELIQQNKVLRVSREQKSRRVKILQKSNAQLTKKLQSLTQSMNTLKQSEQCHHQTSQKQAQKISQLQHELQIQYTKNKALQQMKQKSTRSILQKYNKSIQYSQQIQKQNVKLKNQLNYLKSKYNQDIKNINDGHKNQIIKCQMEFQKLKESICVKDGLIEEKKRQAEYFRDAYEKKDEEFIQLIRSQQKVTEEEKSQIKKIEEQLQKNNEKINKLQMKKEQDFKQIIKITQARQNEKEKSRQKQYIATNKIENDKNGSKQSSIIQLPQTLVHNISPHQKRSFNGFASEQQQQQFDQSLIPISIETKSVGKPVKKKKSERKQVLSSQSRRADTKTHKNSQQKNIRTNLASPKQHKKISKKKKVMDQDDASFTMKSCEPPKTQPMHRITFEDNLGQSRQQQQKQNRVINSYYYSGHQYPPLPHPSYRNMENACEQIHDFHCRNNASCQSIDEAMLIQLQKQLLQLYEEQQNLILASNNELATQAERSEYVGRLKQINEHLRLKNQKICQLKSKI